MTVPQTVKLAREAQWLDDNGKPLAANVTYDHTASGLAATQVQAALDEIVAAAPAVPAFATPAIVLGTSAAAGSATTVIRSDSTIVAFDATAPVTQALGDSAATGSVAKAARRDHKHGMPALSSTTPLVDSGAGAIGTALPSSREDHVHPAASGAGHVLLIGSTHSTPLVFADVMQTTAGDDFVYSS